VASEVFKHYGYEEVKTPAFEPLELFTKKTGITVVKQMYTFQDKSGRWLALRPELTAPVVRLYISQLKSAPKPLKLFYFGSCFRYERPQARRWRQFLQSGAELIGSAQPEADAEVIAMSDKVLRKLGITRYELRIGHIRLLREVLAHAGVRGDAQDPIMRAIDSGDKARLRTELNRAGIESADKQLLKALIALRGDINVLVKAEKLVNKLPKAKAALQNLREIIKCLRLLGVDDFQIDLGIARGLEYYTDMVFELYVNGVQVGGGGRYDELIELLGGKPCPAVGVGFGVDRVAWALAKQGIKVPPERLRCMILPAAPTMLSECLSIAKELREAGITVDVDLMRRSLSKAIAYAGARGADHAIIVGAKDLVMGKVTLRDMRTGEQVQVSREELVTRLRSG
jgi:histidyl-tRNA synthetase